MVRNDALGSIATALASVVARDRARGAPRTRIPWVLRTEVALLQVSEVIDPGLCTFFQLNAVSPTAEGRLPGVAGQAAEGSGAKTNYAQKCRGREQASTWEQIGAMWL